MKGSEIKYVCDLISTVADAVSNNSIPEAEDYLIEKYNSLDDPVLEHTFNVLNNIHNKTI